MPDEPKQNKKPLAIVVIVLLLLGGGVGAWLFVKSRQGNKPPVAMLRLDSLDETNRVGLPELIDAWGQPIVYVKRVREKGPICGPSNSGSIQPQFMLGGVAAYLGWPANNTGSVLSGVPTRIGEMAQCQVQDPTECGQQYSLLTADTPDQRYQTFAFLVRHPGVSPKANGAADLLQGSPRGTMLLLSAGPDGVFYSTLEGAGSASAPVTNLTQYMNNPRVWEDYDDVVIFAGANNAIAHQFADRRVRSAAFRHTAYGNVAVGNHANHSVAFAYRD